MKNFTREIFIFTFSIFVFSAINASAQLCGIFTKKVIVQDETGKAISNNDFDDASVKTFPAKYPRLTELFQMS